MQKSEQLVIEALAFIRWDIRKYDKFGSREFAEVALQAARESEVLLKNEGELFEPFVDVFSGNGCQPRIACGMCKVCHVGIHRVDTAVGRQGSNSTAGCKPY